MVQRSLLPRYEQPCAQKMRTGDFWEAGLHAFVRLHACTELWWTAGRYASKLCARCERLLGCILYAYGRFRPSIPWFAFCSWPCNAMKAMHDRGSSVLLLDLSKNCPPQLNTTNLRLVCQCQSSLLVEQSKWWLNLESLDCRSSSCLLDWLSD